MQPTSRQAYQSVKADGTIQKQQTQILRALSTQSGNAYQVSLRITLDKHSVGRRMSELLADKLIRPDGMAPTDSGRNAIVYTITEAGRAKVPQTNA